MNTIKFEIPGLPEYIWAIGLAVSKVASSRGYDMSEIEDLKLSLDEGIKLMSCHEKKLYTQKLEIVAEIAEDKTEIRISDISSGDGYEKEVRLCACCPSEGEIGRGIISVLMDETRLENDDKKTLIMVKRRG